MKDFFLTLRKNALFFTNPKSSFTTNKKEILAAFLNMSKNLRLFTIVMLLVGTLSLIFLIWIVSSRNTVVIAVPGGSISEGLIGSPRFINPLLSVSDSDRDMVSLIYSGLMRRNSSGELIPDLAEKVEISEDYSRFTFTLKDNLTWHDGTPLTTSDIEYTINKTKDPAIQSPRRPNWEGVKMEIKDDLTITFNLQKPYANFLDNTTMGIIPKHIWNPISVENFAFSEYNNKPIGSGPYLIDQIEKDNSGITTTYYLKPFYKFALGTPKVDLTIKIYPNENERLFAYEKGDINAMSSISPETAKTLKQEDSLIKEAELPRIFALFFNQNQNPIFAHKEVRQALDVAIDKKSIVKNILLGYGKPLSGPTISQISTQEGTAENYIKQATNILEKAGWSKNSAGIYEKKTKTNTEKLKFTINTSDAPELKETANFIVETWKKLGAEVDVKIFDTGALQQQIIRPRKYDALLFGQIIGREPDLFAFWHSSQRLDPGLNIAQYANTTVDKLLEENKTEINPEIRDKNNNEILLNIMNDTPAVFLYTPSFIYVLPTELKGVSIGTIQTTGDRFSEIYKVYSQTESVWKIFAEEKSIIKN